MICVCSNLDPESVLCNYSFFALEQVDFKQQLELVAALILKWFCCFPKYQLNATLSGGSR